MSRCSEFQSQMLDHLYGLLETEQVEALQAHLARCPSCEAAMAGARRQQQLLAMAARKEFADVRFAAPSKRDRALPLRPGHVWRRWAVAAAILVAAGVGIPAAFYKYEQTRRAGAEDLYAQLAGQAAERRTVPPVALTRAREVRDAAMQELQAGLAERQRQLLAVQQEIDQLDAQHRQRLEQVYQEAAGQPLSVMLTGPRNYEPGARNDYRLTIRDQANQPAAAHVSTQLLDQDQHVLYQEDQAARGGEVHLRLPPDLGLKPGSEPQLVVTARGDQGARGEVREIVRLVAPIYLTHLTTDKPMYQPGEVVHFRSLTLERSSLRPPREDLHLVFTVTTPAGEKQDAAAGLSRLVDGKGAGPVTGPDGQPVRGVGAGEYLIGPEAAGGEYTLAVSEAGNRFPPEQRKFLVNRYEKPQLDKELEFTRKSYGPGADVVAACKATRVTGQPAARAAVSATVQVDGRSYDADGHEPARPIAGVTDEHGAVAIRFRLPAQIERGQASLAVTFRDGGNVETIVRAVPVVLKKLQIEFYPEGGYLVAGVANRVYLQALTLLNRPAEIRGRVVDDLGREVTKVETLHDDHEAGINQGMGRFDLIPEAARRYELKLDSPTGIDGRFPLPIAEAERVGLTVPSGVTGPHEPIRIKVWSGKGDRSLLVGAYCRGLPMARAEVRVRERQPAEIEMRPEGGAGGVYRITVFEKVDGDRNRLVPRAERLIYRAPAGQLSLRVQADRQRYTPGAPVKLRLEARDEKEQLVPAVALVAVVDKSVLKLADEKTFHALPTHFLLATEVHRPEDLEHADVLLGRHPQAAAALDLLLGTQGWRRFAEQEPGLFRGREGEEADRWLAANGRAAPGGAAETSSAPQQKAQRLDAEFQARIAPLADRLALLRPRAEAAQARSAALNGMAVADGIVHPEPAGRPAKGQQAADVEKQDAALDPELARLQDRLSLAQAGLARAEQEAGTGTAEAEALSRKAGAARRESILAGARLARMQRLTVLLGDLVLPLLAATLVLGALGLLLVRALKGKWSSPLPRWVPGTCCVLTGALMTVGGLYLWGGGGPPEWELASAPKPMAAAKAERGEDSDQAGAGAGRFLEEALQRRATSRGVVRLGAAGASVPAPPIPLNAPADQPVEPGQAKGQARGVARAIEKEAKEGDGGVGGRRHRAEDQEGRAPGFAQDGLKKDAARRMAGKMKTVGDKLAALDRKILPRQQAQAQHQMPALRAALREQAVAGIRADDANMIRLAPQSPPPLPALVVREYAHRHLAPEDGLRQDFTETLCWRPVLVLPDGRAEVAFDLSDSVTTFQVLVAGHTLDGRLGAVTADVASQLPLTIQPKLPIEVSSTDRIDLPVTVANNTDTAQSVHWQVQSTGLELEAGNAGDLTIGPDQRARQILRLRPSLVEGRARLRLDARGQGAASDTIERTLAIVPDGFPIVGTQSDLLEGSARVDGVRLPETWVPGTLKCQVAVFPSTMADLQKGLEGMLREPYGCFEQTSSTNYPNVLTLDYLRQTGQAQPELARRALEFLSHGYQRLASFECNDPSSRKHEGYEWFGGAVPPHEALTAYGLMQFCDMARVFDVDPAMVERTRAYLLSRRDGKGGFFRNPRSLDTFGHAPDPVTNAYIVWALTESGSDDVGRELDAVARDAKDSRDPYFLALVANSLLNRDRRDEARSLLRRMGQAQQKDGHLDAATTSITGSGGRDLQIETTALAVYGWLKARRPELFHQPIQEAVRWLGQQRGGYGGYGSTQSTVLALKALVVYARSNKESTRAGDLVLSVGGREVARKHFPAGVQEAVVLDLPEPDRALRTGQNDVCVELTGGNVLPYTATWSYRALKPAADSACPVTLATGLDREAAAEGEAVRLSVRVENHSGKGQGMTVAVVGLPAGLTVPEDLKDLKELTRQPADGSRPQVSYFELRGRELVLYWRDLPPEARLEVSLPLIARVPGEYRGPASRAYLYYNADHKAWVDPLKITIRAAGGKQ